MRPRIEPLNSSLEDLAHLGRIAPVVGRPGVLLALGADEGAVLDPGDVVRVGAGQVGVRPLRLRELLEGAARRPAPGRGGRTPPRSRRTSGSTSGSVRSANCSTQAISFLFLVRLLAAAVLSLKGGLNSSLSFPAANAEAIPDVGPLFRTPPDGGVSCRSLAHPRAAASATRQARFPAPHALLRVRVTADRRAGRDPGHEVRLLQPRPPRPARPPSEIGGPGGDQVPGADRRADEGRRGQVRRHARGGRGARRGDPRAGDQRAHAASACSSIRRPRSPRSTTRASSGTGRAKRPMMLFSDMGGIDIEEVAEQPPRPRRARPPLQPASDLRLPGQAGDRAVRRHRARS